MLAKDGGTPAQCGHPVQAAVLGAAVLKVALGTRSLQIALGLQLCLEPGGLS